jgi:hypothetical protein
MKQKLMYALFALTLLAAWACSGGGTTKDKTSATDGSSAYSGPPYTVQLAEYVNPNLPDLHSYTHAIYQDKIVMIGGRTNGLHGDTYNFYRRHSNKTIFVINTNNWATPDKWTVKSLLYSSPLLAGAAAGINLEQFKANNAQFFTEDSVLYIVGGLLGSARPTQLKQPNNPQSGLVLVPGTKVDKADAMDRDTVPTTLPYITAVTLPALINTVNNGVPLKSGSIRQIKDNQLAVTGGELELIGKTVKLVFGWNFSLDDNGDRYTHQIRSFTYTDNGKTLSISPITVCLSCWDTESDTSKTGNFRRRDGSMSTMIDPANGKEALLYYAGVFKNGNDNFDNPVWIGSDNAVEESFVMRSNVYTCQVVPVYSPSRQQSYATLMGGMKNALYTGASSKLPILLNEGNAPITSKAGDFSSIPFSNQLSTLMIDKQHQYSQYLLPDSFPATKIAYPFLDTTALPANSNPFNGSESELLWTLSRKNGRMPHGVVNYDDFIKANPEGGSIGYLHGGILSMVENAFHANNQAKVTRASNRIFVVKIVPLKQ